MGSALGSVCGGADDYVVRTVLDWLTPIEVPVGPGSLSLTDADFADDDDNVKIDLKHFEINDVALTGEATAKVPFLGEQTADVRVTLSINKPYKQNAKVDVTNVEFPGNDALSSIIGIGAVRDSLCSVLEDQINTKLADHGGNDSEDEDEEQ
mmetsp:Transcript_96661/g.152951  ORF Transcript_96661/g.152951 Transcript_96661/m.152951 type:complete len:152 (-) Transcript_96661:106-561(-)